ncbi:hypothetical protein HY947_04710 [Candidatus Gottesmanbacteria bacterium]|nr:hypothetical protein [Candidatus Gottesmanbacteria bacterium]
MNIPSTNIPHVYDAHSSFLPRLFVLILMISVIIVFFISGFLSILKHKNDLEVFDQILGSGKSVDIESVTIGNAKGARIVLSLHGMTDGRDWVGMSPWLAPGKHTHIGVRLNVIEGKTDSRTTTIAPKKGDILYAMLYKAEENMLVVEEDIQNILFDLFGRSLVKKFVLL